MFNLTGKTLGKYRLVEQLGQGGMAQVYKAYQPDLDRYVAVKVLHPNLTGDEAFADRFRREARAIAALEHPHVVRVYDFDAAEGLAFLVMEHLEGASLKARLRYLERTGGRMELSEVGTTVGALAEALDYAHRRGVVHRDVKPSNVIVTAEGRPVLTDFGIARMVDATAVTGSGGTLGTPAYMSPEQGQGQPGDARSDIYALGVLLYQLCTGHLPFDADTPYAIILKHITAPLPPPRSLRPDLPEAVERVIFRALAKDPADRFQTASEMAAALRAAIEARIPPRISRIGTNWLDAVREIRPPQLSRAGRGAIRGKAYAVLIGAAAVVLLALTLLTRSWWAPRLSPLSTAEGPAPSTVEGSTAEGLTPTPTIEARSATLVLQGPEVVEDTWIDPDTPDQVWQDADLVHLQGPLTPDRLLFHFDLSGLPASATAVSAALSLRVELWGDQSLPSAAVVYRVLTPWEPGTTNYNQPWSAPGLAAGWDYDATPLDLAPLPDAGQLTLDVSRAFVFWRERGQPNYGLVVMTSEDSHNQAHHWVYMSEQPDPADRPTLEIAYEVNP